MEKITKVFAFVFVVVFFTIAYILWTHGEEIVAMMSVIMAALMFMYYTQMILEFKIKKLEKKLED